LRAYSLDRRNGSNSMPPAAPASTKSPITSYDGRISVNSGSSSSIEGNGVATAVGGEDGSDESDDDGGQKTSASWHAVSRFNEVTKINTKVMDFRQNSD
jgi:transcription elongation factor